jgi:hypothetical protein
LATTIKFPTAHTSLSQRKDPDLSYKFLQEGCKFPGLVIEVAWSQRKLDLERLAKRYIEGSNGDIRTVVGVNLNDIYHARRNEGTATATFSVWRAELDSSGKAKINKNVVEDQVCFLAYIAKWS